MPYRYYTCKVDGKKRYCAKNLKTGKVTRFKSEAKRDKGIQMRHAFEHGWEPTKIGLANASKKTRRRVSKKGGKTSKRKR